MVTNQVADKENKKIEKKVNTCKIFSKTLNNKNISYREAVGTLLYLANASQPDICYSVNVLSRHKKIQQRTNGRTIYKHTLMQVLPIEEISNNQWFCKSSVAKIKRPNSGYIY